jgi:hypothetical protein
MTNANDEKSQRVPFQIVYFLKFDTVHEISKILLFIDGVQ